MLVLGDAMADWLAYGLEDAFSEQPDMGVIRKHRTVSGLIRYHPRGEPSDWAAAAKGIIAQEKADAIVVMLGLQDRTTIREPVAEKPDPKKDAGKKADSKSGAKQDTAPGTAKKPDDKPEDAEAPPADDQADNDTPSIAAPERTTRAANGLNEFRSERWVELYKKKIDDMIGVLKTKGVPILWVGLPALRGPKATSDMLFLDSLYRESASKAGITYVDIWDGFVDEAGRFMQQGPDFEGQTRRLRTGDGVFFTKPGARKMAHYVDREIKRLLANRSMPVALAERSGHARHQYQARRSGAASARRSDPAAGGVLGRHRPTARRRRHAACRGRCACCTDTDQGRAAGGPRRTRGRLHLAAPRGRQDRRQGRHPDRCGKCGRRRRHARNGCAAAEARETPSAPGRDQHRAGKLPVVHHAAAGTAAAATRAPVFTAPARACRPLRIRAPRTQRPRRILHALIFPRSVILPCMRSTQRPRSRPTDLIVKQPPAFAACRLPTSS